MKITKKTMKSALLLMGLSMVLALVLAACGGDDPTPTSAPAATPTATTASAAAPTPTTPPAAAPTPTSAPIAVPTPTTPPAPVEKPVLIFADLNWNSAQMQNAIARLILEDGYGYETEAIFGGTVPMFQALVNGDVNVSMEIWLPNQLAAYESALASDTIASIGKSLEDNWQSSFIIPQYTADANPGLTSVTDIPDYMDLFVTPDSKGKARLITCIPGWECETVNENKIVAYGLEDSVELINPGSGAALEAEIRSAFQKNEDVLFYYWGPTTLSNDLNADFGGYLVLDEPDYSVACWEDDFGCAYPTAEVLITVRSELLESAPDAVEFFKKWDFSAPNQLAAEGYQGETQAEFAEVAKWFVLNTEDWKTWVAAGVADKVLAAAAQ